MHHCIRQLLHYYSNMDLGDLRFVSFTTLDEDLEVQACRTPFQVRDQLSQQLVQSQSKILITQQVLASLAAQLRDVEVARARLGLSLSNIANHPIVMRLSALTTSHHMVRRYQLVLLRDIMRMKHALGTHVNPRLWEGWYRAEAQLQQEAPNVHNLFLWSLEIQDNEEGNDLLPLTRFTPWRPYQ